MMTFIRKVKTYIAEFVDSLFEVKQSKFTLKKVFLTFALFILVGSTLPMTMVSQKNNYAAYAKEFSMVREAYEAFVDAHGYAPVGNEVDWKKEKDLSDYFEESNVTKGATFYYLDLGALSLDTPVKRTYVLDMEKERLYTREFVSYDMRRWHFPGAQ